MRETVNYILVGIATALIIYLVSPSILSTKVEIVEVNSVNNTESSSLRTSYSDTFNKVKSSVITIYTERNVPQRNYNLTIDPQTRQLKQEPTRRASGQGSGVVVSRAGHIITNFHVIHSATAATVLDYEGNQYTATLIGVAPETDLAVLKVDGPMQPITFANISTVNVGDVALAIGNPFGVGQSITLGIISATGRERLGLNTYERFLQTDAAINSGNSGGALVNVRGEMIGINTAISSEKGGSDGIGWAIPVDMVKNVLTQIIEIGEVVRGFLGLTAVPDFNGRGVLINSIFKNGPADQAGSRMGDVVRKINDVEVNDIKALISNIKKTL